MQTVIHSIMRRFIYSGLEGLNMLNLLKNVASTRQVYLNYWSMANFYWYEKVLLLKVFSLLKVVGKGNSICDQRFASQTLTLHIVYVAQTSCLFKNLIYVFTYIILMVHSREFRYFINPQYSLGWETLNYTMVKH